MKRRPCAYYFVSALLGAFFGIYGAKSLSELAVACLLMLILMLIPKNLVRVLTLLSFIFFICAAGALFHKQKYDETLQAIPTKDMANFSGIVEAVLPKIDAKVVATLTINGVNHKPCLPFTMQVTFTDAASRLDFLPNQKILVRTLPKPLPPALSDAHFDGYHYGLAHTIHMQAQVEDAQMVFLSAGEQPSWIKQQQQRLRTNIMATLTPRESSLLLALMIGDTSLFERDQKDLFKNLGAQHLLAVSGLQVSLIAFFCFFIFATLFAFLLPHNYCHFSKFAAALLTLAFIWTFVFLCGCPKSAVRAAVMTSILLSTLGLAREIDPIDALFLSGFLYILSDPLCTIDLGFLLSYSAVLGISIALSNSQEARQKLQEKTRVGFWGLTLLLTSIAASLATLPVIANYFFSYAPLSIIANLILVPVATLFQTPAIVLGMMGAIFSWDILISIAAKCAFFIEIVAQVLLENIGSSLIFLSYSKITILISTISIFLLFILIIARHRGAILMAVLSVSAPATEWAMKQIDEDLTVTLIPVGQGDATLFALSSGHHILIDAGGSMQPDFDPGEKFVLPTLKRKGVTSLDVLAITHPDPDHLMGAFSLLENIPIKEIWIGGFMKDHEQGNQFLRRAHEKNIPIKSPHELLGSHTFGQCEVQVLAPHSHDANSYPELSTNDNSLVIRILFAGKTLLWPGDIEYFGEQLLLSDNFDISADLLKAPHHGSKTSSSVKFIEQVKPSYVFYSTGHDNRFGFPHAEVVERYQKMNVTALNTATHGEINIKINKKGLSIVTYLTPLKSKNSI